MSIRSYLVICLFILTNFSIECRCQIDDQSKFDGQFDKSMTSDQSNDMSKFLF